MDLISDSCQTGTSEYRKGMCFLEYAAADPGHVYHHFSAETDGRARCHQQSTERLKLFV